MSRAAWPGPRLRALLAAFAPLRRRWMLVDGSWPARGAQSAAPLAAQARADDTRHVSIPSQREAA